jgi:hypothetical protein
LTLQIQVLHFHLYQYFAQHQLNKAVHLAQRSLMENATNVVFNSQNQVRHYLSEGEVMKCTEIASAINALKENPMRYPKIPIYNEPSMHFSITTSDASYAKSLVPP